MKTACVLLLLSAAAHGRNLRSLSGSSGPLPRGGPRDPRIVGGQQAAPGQFPFQIAFLRDGEWFCGGSIYDETHILTAAHCCDAYPISRYSLSIRAGDIDQELDEGSEQFVEVASVTMHEDFNNPVPFSNDVCWLKLADSLVFNDFVQPVSFPAQGQSFSGQAVVSGWGALESGDIFYPDELSFVAVPILTDADCIDQAFYPEARITEDMICAGEPGVDSCQGDSGGPMTCTVSGDVDDGTGATDNRILCGVVSWGWSCAAYRRPGVYAEVSYQIDWIQEQISNE